jgi:hypothetical protein
MGVVAEYFWEDLLPVRFHTICVLMWYIESTELISRLGMVVVTGFGKKLIENTASLQLE